MTNINEIIDNLISSVQSDLIETRHEIKQLEREIKAYETVISKLKELKGDVE